MLLVIKSFITEFDPEDCPTDCLRPCENVCPANAISFQDKSTSQISYDTEALIAQKVFNLILLKISKFVFF